MCSNMVHRFRLHIDAVENKELNCRGNKLFQNRKWKWFEINKIFFAYIYQLGRQYAKEGIHFKC